jgi:hypothetical protein
MVSVKLPYSETLISQNQVIRTFDETLDPIELMWHRDDESRVIEPVGETDWQIQLEDRLPFAIDHAININRHEWHRLIKGSGELTLKITKLPV